MMIVTSLTSIIRQIDFSTTLTSQLFATAILAFCIPVFFCFITCESMSQILQRVRFDESLMMKRSMRGASEHYEIFQSIIAGIAIDVMDYLIRCYRALEMFGHYKNTFTDISVFARIRMRRQEQINTTIRVMTNTTLPVRICFAMPRTFFSTHISRLSSILHIVKRG